MPYEGEQMLSSKVERTPNRRILASLLGANELRRRTRWDSGDFTEEELAELKESVMEHVGGLLVTANRLYDQAEQDGDTYVTSLDWKKVTDLISIHDISETIFGDLVEKTGADKDAEERAEMEIIRIAESKMGLSARMGELLDEYAERMPDGSKSSPEANFVKSIDELDGLLKMMHSSRLDTSKRTIDEERDFFKLYAINFPTVHNFAVHLLDVIEQMQVQGMRGQYKPEQFELDV